MPTVDTFHPTIKDAYAEAARRKADPAGKEMIVRVEQSGYGGWRVRSIPSDLYVDQIIDGPFLPDGGLTRHMVGA